MPSDAARPALASAGAMAALLLCTVTGTGLATGDPSAPPAGEGSFTLDGEEHALGRLVVVEAGDRYNPGVHQFTLHLTSSGVSVGKYGPSGSGDAVVLTLHADGEALEAGSYPFETAVKPEPGTVNGTTVYTGYDFEDGEGGEYAILGGTVELAVSGDGRELSLDLEVSPVGASGTMALEGSYTGPVDARHSLQR